MRLSSVYNAILVVCLAYFELLLHLLRNFMSLALFSIQYLPFSLMLMLKIATGIIIARLQIEVSWKYY